MSTHAGHVCKTNYFFMEYVDQALANLYKYIDVFLQIDTQSNMVRKLQRTCDDLQETNENYQSQNAHLQSR